MVENLKNLKITYWIIPIVLFNFMSPNSIQAHCDTASGPVAVAAHKALETGKFETIAIWVGEKQEHELRERFEQCLAIYKTGDDAKALAERYFIETAVRLHREAEGMTYNGLKPAQPLPEDISEAEKALETGNLQPVTNLLSMAIEKETQKWFHKALDAKKEYQGESVETGREWVDAYVKYVIYVHGLYKRIQAGPEHGVGHVE